MVADHHDFARLVRQVFSQRRKTVRNTLRGLLTAAAIQEAGVDPSARPEVLSIAQFARLAELLPKTPSSGGPPNLWEESSNSHFDKDHLK
ncbi:hypothetical protein CCP3SC15_4560002 [Gammaproteobacteria bacterium]